MLAPKHGNANSFSGSESALVPIPAKRTPAATDQEPLEKPAPTVPSALGHAAENRLAQLEGKLQSVYGVQNVRSHADLEKAFGQAGLLHHFVRGDGYTFEKDRLEHLLDTNSLVDLVYEARKLQSLKNDKILTSALIGPDGRMTALRQVLTLGDRLRLHIALDHDAAHAALPQFNGQAHADRPASDDHDVGIMLGRSGQFRF